MIEITSQEQLENLILQENKTVVVDFAAPAWCIPCQRFAPHFEMASKKTDAAFAHVDVDKAEWAMVEYGVQSVPTVMLFKNGQYVKHLKERTAPKLLQEIEE